MADGFRITESGDLRVSETSDSRITEQFVPADPIALSGSGTLSADPTIKNGIASLSGAGTLASEASKIRPGVSALTADGSQLAAGELTLFGRAEFFGAGTQTSVGDLTFGGKFEPSVDVDGTRYTEGGADIRITEGGDTRVVLINENFGGSVLTASGTKTTFNSDMFINVSDVWKESIPYVKYEGEWQEPIAIYKNVSGNWKRVH